MNDEERKAKLATFVRKVEQCSTGDLAVLRRNAGERWNKDPRCAWFPVIAPDGEPMDVAFLVATLLAQYKTATIQGKDREHWLRNEGNFGETFARVVSQRDDSGRFPGRILEDCRRDKKQVPSIVRRMYVLLDSEIGPRLSGDLPYRLRQLLRMAVTSKKIVGVDWVQLFLHIDGWSHPDRWVQKEWASSFFTSTGAKSSDQTEQAETDAD